MRFHIIRNAYIQNVGQSQSCMVYKLRIIWKRTRNCPQHRLFHAYTLSLSLSLSFSLRAAALPILCYRRRYRDSAAAAGHWLLVWLLQSATGPRPTDPSISAALTKAAGLLGNGEMISPHDAVHVGDDLTSDVHGGNTAGFRTIYYYPRHRVSRSPSTRAESSGQSSR